MRRLLLLLFILLPHNTAAEALKIKISGVSGEILDNVRAHLSLYRQREHPALSALRIKRLHRGAEQEIHAALKPFSYYRAEIQSELKQMPAQGENEAYWLAHYTIEPGPPLLINAVDIVLQGDAADDPALREYKQEFPLRAGDKLLHQKYEEAKKALLDLARERGYFDAILTRRELRIDLKNYQAEVLLHLNGKKRYHLGPAKFEQSYYSDEFLQRFLTYQEGDPYLADTLLELQSSLIDSLYFSRVEVQADFAAAQDGSVPVLIRLEPRKPNRWSASIGYGTDTGVRGSLGWERYRINRHGHRFKTELRASERKNAWVARYFIPIGRPNEDYLSFSAGYEDEDTDTSSETAFTLGAGRHRPRLLRLPFSDNALRLNEVVSLEYRREDFSAGLDEGISTLLIPALEWVYSKADDQLYPRRGHSLKLKLSGASEAILSDLSFTQSLLEGALVRPAGKKGRFIGRAQMGLTWVSDFAELPSSLRFFAGGDQSVRGYGYHHLGPLDESGAVGGGRYLLTGSVEYEHTIYKKWSAALFYDTGNAMDSFNESLKSSAGVGVRWRSPVGLVRLDFAHPFNADRSVRVHLRIGPDL